MKVKMEEGVKKETQIAPYFGGLNLICFATPSITKGQLLDVSEGAVGTFGRVCYKVFELELRLFDHETDVCKEAEEVLVENGEGGDVVF